MALFSIALVVGTSLLAGALSLDVRRRQQALLGAVLASDLPGRRGRHVGTLALVALALGASLAFEPGWWVFAMLLPVVLVNELRPSGSDRVCGTEGVRRGWYVRSLGELEEWRLMGDHLRFRLFGEWTAVPVPAQHREGLLERLREQAGARESGFNQ